MPVSAPTAKIPEFKYVDLTGANQALTFDYPPINVVPMVVNPLRADTIAGDGTAYSTWWYDEVYTTLTAQVPLGPSLTNWLAFLLAAANGQVVQYLPDHTNPGYSVNVRLMIGSQSSGSGSSSVAPSGNPAPKRVGFGMYQVDVVLRYETPTDAPTAFAALNGL